MQPRTAALKPLVQGEKKNQKTQKAVQRVKCLFRSQLGDFESLALCLGLKKRFQAVKGFHVVCFLHPHEYSKILFSESFRCCLPRNGFPVCCAPNIFFEKAFFTRFDTEYPVSSLGVRCIVYRCFSSQNVCLNASTAVPVPSACLIHVRPSSAGSTARLWLTEIAQDADTFLALGNL